MPSRAPLLRRTTQPGAADPVRVSRRSRRRLAAAGVGGLGAAAGALAVAAALLQPPAPIRLAPIGSDYAENLSVPHNAHAWNSLSDACRVRPTAPGGWGRESLVRGPAAPLRVDDRFAFESVLEHADEPTVVVLVALHGGSDERGPYLLRENCRPDDPPEARLRVADLFAALGKLPESTNKLVVFDAATSAGEPFWGDAENRFAEGLKALEPQVAATPGLVVVATSDAGQLSWPCPDGRRSAALNAFAEALAGYAPDANDDGRVSAAEMFDHVRAAAAANAGSVWRRAQTPLLLPQSAEGRRLAERMELALCADEPAPSPTDPPPNSDGLDSLWRHAERLAEAAVAPESTASVVWRRYRRTLLRYEELTLAGATAAAERLATRLDELESMVRRQSRWAGSLPDPVELSAGPLDDPSVAAELEKLWDAPAEATPPLIEGLSADADGTRLGAVHGWLVDRVQAGPSANLRHGAELLGRLPAADGLRPSASHLVLMLDKGLPPNRSHPDWNHALQMAIGARRAADHPARPTSRADAARQATAMSWLFDRFDEADRSRREGEDLLFGGDQYLPGATAALESASDAYAALHADAATVRGALAARDDAFDLLPFYGDAIAAIPVGVGDRPEEVARLLGALEDAWQTAHGLADVLDPPSRGQPVATPQEILAKRTALEGRLEQLRADVAEWRAAILTRTGAAARAGRLAALRTPDIGAGERQRLVGAAPRLDETARRAVDLDDKRQADWRREAAVRRVRVALAAIGRRLYDRGVGRAGAHLADTASLKASDANAAAAARVARRVGQAWRSAALDATLVAQRIEQGSPATVALGDWPSDAAPVRRLDWGQTGLSGQTVLDAMVCRSRFDYYRWRAERAAADGWAGAAVDDPPYATAAAKAYASLADRALPGDAEIDRFLQRVAEPFQLGVDGPSRIDVVDRVATRPAITVSTSAPAPSGVAAVWAELPGDTAPARRRIVPLGQAATIPLGPSLTDSAAATTRFVAWRRGYTASIDVPLTPHAGPAVSIDNPPAPAGAAVALLADGPIGGDGAVAFVLDASGSMGRAPGAASSKYEQAVAELRRLLADTPRGVRVSVWVFGQAQGDAKTVDPPEAAIRRVVDPVSWDPADPGLLDRVARRLAYPRIEPWNESALGRAVLTASRDLQAAAGYKAVIAVTDGVDNRFANDPLANPEGESIGDVLSRELSASGVALHVIGFALPPDAQRRVQEQFAFVQDMRPQGGYWPAANPESLARVLQTVWGARSRAPVVAPIASGGRALGEALVSPAQGMPVWPSRPLPTGWYSLPVGAQQASPPRAFLGGGDLLLVRLSGAAGAPSVSRAGATRLLWPDKPAAESAGWRGAVLNRRRTPDGGASTSFALERLPSGAPDAVMRVARPAWVWFERECIGEQPTTIAWRRVDGYPCPVWEVRAEGGADSKACPDGLRVWWSADPPQAAIAARRGEDFDKVEQLLDASWDIDGQPTRLLRLAAETRRLPDASGRRTDQPCVVVHLSGAARCHVQLDGVGAKGERHDYYDAAGQSVAVFWPVEPAELKTDLRALRLSSVEDMKRRAEAAGALLEFRELRPATPEDLRPAPSVGWFAAGRL
ncbi:vWA domain-containing protein [Botrimarina sp.]|uniref:vWA domain-containing protein n=1 Tax=Botrimarina sp. TaxID=2795802 RepID=UPI0032F03A28